MKEFGPKGRESEAVGPCDMSKRRKLSNGKAVGMDLCQDFWFKNDQIWEKVKEQWRRPLVDICSIVIRCPTFDWDDGKTMQIQPSCPVDNLYSGFNFVVGQIGMK